MTKSLKPVEFRGNALDELRGFPDSARREAGHQIDRLQRGWQPFDWKPMPSLGRGVEEIRIRDEAGQFRVVYVARFTDVVCVLHCFQKKTQRTSRKDIDLVTKRFKALMQERKP